MVLIWDSALFVVVPVEHSMLSVAVLILPPASEFSAPEAGFWAFVVLILYSLLFVVVPVEYTTIFVAVLILPPACPKSPAPLWFLGVNISLLKRKGHS